MGKRTGQSGTVEKHGCNWRGKYYEDRVGSPDRVCRRIVLGAISSMSKAQAKRKLRQHIDRLGLNSSDYEIPSDTPAVTFGPVSERWESNVLSGKKRSTRRTVESELRRHLRPAFEKLPIDQINPQMVTDHVAKWHRSGLSVKSIKNLVITLNMVRKYAGLPCFPAKAVAYPSNSEAVREVPCFTSDHVSLILAEAKGWHRIYFATAAATGLRAGELAGLRIETGDVDLNRKLIHVRRSVFDGAEQSPKSHNAYRWIPIDDELTVMLKAHIGDRRIGYVFHTRTTGPVRLNNILRRTLHPILRKHNIPRAGMHAFRHYRCSFLVENNVPVAVIKQWLGHGSERMIRRYTHHRPEYHSAILAQLPSVFTPRNGEKIALLVPNSPKPQFDRRESVA